MLIPQQKLASRQLGISATALRLWSGEPDFPHTAGGYDLDAIRAWLAARGSPKADPKQAQQGTQIKLATAAETLKQKRLRTEADRLSLEQKKGELVPRGATELFAAALLTGLADWCDQLPDLIAGELPVKHRKRIHGRLKQELDSRRQQLAQDLEQRAREHAAAASPPASHE